MNTLEKSRNTQSLTTTLALAFLALIVVALLISSGFQLFFTVQTQQEAISEQQQLLAQGAAEKVSGFVQDQFGGLAACRRSNFEQAMDGPQSLKTTNFGMLRNRGEPFSDFSDKLLESRKAVTRLQVCNSRRLS